MWGDCVPGSPATPLTDAGARFSRSDSGRRPQPWDARYLLVCHARSLSLINGVWCFTLESLTGDSLIEAEDEDEGDLNRLSLLAAVRGLEAIDGQSIVSLISNNRYLIRSLDSSLPRWRENDFLWEDFGRKVAVQNADLWRRIDRTLGIHEVTATLVQTTRVSSHRESPLGRLPDNGRSQPFAGPFADPAADHGNFRVDPAHPQPHVHSQGHAHPQMPGQPGGHGQLSGSHFGGFDHRRPADGDPFGSPITPPTDRLRRWLVGDETPQPPRPPRRGRYSAADLALD
ncbi:MAG: hypothetical protein EA381_12690 [Planctomycetaceae bacterium]|nr:MAG: hypothetical protein EA381_12690 [Planctomycetaceae bacterium]